MLQMSFSVPVLNLDAPADEQTHARVYAKVCWGEEAGVEGHGQGHMDSQLCV